MATKIKVMIVDDSALVRQVITQAISRDPSIEVVATAQDPIFALEKLKTLWPDVIVLDIEMPGESGLQVLQRIKSSRSDICVAMFTQHANSQHRARGLMVLTVIEIPVKQHALDRRISRNDGHRIIDVG